MKVREQVGELDGHMGLVCLHPWVVVEIASGQESEWPVQEEGCKCGGKKCGLSCALCKSADARGD